jgi:hypothetical protein
MSLAFISRPLAFDSHSITFDSGFVIFDSHSITFDSGFITFNSRSFNLSLASVFISSLISIAFLKLGANRFSRSIQQRAIAWSEQPIITNLDKSSGQHVLKESADEFFGSDSCPLHLISSRFLVLECHLAVFQLLDSVVGDRHSKDVRREILEGCFTCAHRLTK